MFDVCVIGGGPAGSALALRLARLGRRVALIEKASSRARCSVEALTGAVLPLLDVLGIPGDIAEGIFVPVPRTTLQWAGRLENQRLGTAYLVRRNAFDSVLLRAAMHSGVFVKQPTRVTDSKFDGRWSLKLDSGDVLHARYLADATGRSGFVSGKKTAIGIQTIALFADWYGVDPQDGSMLVEAGTSEWFWGAPLPGGTFSAAVFLDAKRARKYRYRELIRSSNLLAERLANGICGSIRACDATSFVDQTPVTDRFIKVGEAVLSIDPLSSQGVQIAMGTALHSAAVLNTIIDRPHNASLAAEFYRRRIYDYSTFHALAAARLYRDHYEAMGGHFWQERSGASVPNQPSKSELLLHQYVRIADRVSFVLVPTIADRYVVETDGIELNGSLYACINGLNVAHLLRTINQPTKAARIVDKWSRFTSQAVAAKILQWAWREGLLVMTT